MGSIGTELQAFQMVGALSGIAVGALTLIMGAWMVGAHELGYLTGVSVEVGALAMAAGALLAAVGVCVRRAG